MRLILNNPYRIVGLLVGATAREQERQVKRLKQFIEAEIDSQDDFSFPVIGNINRTIESVTSAASKLNLNSDRMNAALFWFYKGNPITDEPALEALKESDKLSSTEIWTKIITKKEVTQRNISAFQNLSTLILCNAFNGSEINENFLEQGISLKLKFLESDLLKDFKSLVADETYKVTKKELQLLFLTQLQSEIEKYDGNISRTFLEIVNKQEFSAKEDFIKGFVQNPIEQIEKKIEESKSRRKANKEKAVVIGKELFDQTFESLSQLKSILGKSNIKYSIISDKVSDEILQCGIEYFSHFRDSNIDPGNDSMLLFKKAISLAVGNVAKQRCRENTVNLQEWIDDKPEREEQNKIKSEVEKLIEIFQEFDNKDGTIENAKILINKCKPSLAKIKSVLGGLNDLFLKLSTRVASQAQSFIIEEINSVQNIPVKFNYNFVSEDIKRTYLNIFRNKLKEAWEVSTLIGSLESDLNFKVNYKRNKDSLLSLCNQFSVDTSGFKSSPFNNPTKTKSFNSSSFETPSKKFDRNAWWILGLIGLLIGAAINGVSSAIIGLVIGIILGLIQRD